ncbi:MAG: hypothetical protein AAGF11_15860 [Myxococcota bacterium]
MKPLRLLVAVLLLLTASACASKDDAPPAVEKITVATRSAPTITLDDPGQEPRAPLRLRPAAGTRETLELAIGMTMGMRSDGQDLPAIPVPTTRTRLSSQVQQAGPDGITVKHAVEDMSVEATSAVPQAVVDQVRATIEPLRKYQAVTRMDPRGIVLGGDALIPRDMPVTTRQTMQQLTESMGQLTAPLPREAVGIGARWTAVSDITQNGMKLRQTVHYTLVARAEDQATLELTLEQVLLDSKVDVPGTLGSSARVGRFDSAGRGTVELDLRHVSPTSVQMTIELSMAMDISAMGQEQRMEMDMNLDMSISRLGQ